MAGLKDTFTYQNFSWKGDMRWATTSRFTKQAPLVAFILCIISMILVSLGSTWLVQMNRITFPKVFQTLFIPGLSFFHTIPSLHAHLLLRRNPPTVAFITSLLFAAMMLLSPLLMLSSCINSPTASPSLRQAECYSGTPGRGGDSGANLAVWVAMVVFSLVSAAAYAVHAAMAWMVRRHLLWKRRSGVQEVVDPEEEERRKAKARELWVKMTRDVGGMA